MTGISRSSSGILTLFLIPTLFLLFTSCIKPTEVELQNPYDPNSDSYRSYSDIQTKPVTSIERNGAVTGGDFLENYGTRPQRKGVCWSMEPNPTLVDQCTDEGGGFGPGEFTSEMSGLEMTAKYYVRAYYTNTDTTVYGNQIQFSTDNRISHGLVSGVTPDTGRDEYVYTTFRSKWQGEGGGKVWLKMNLGSSSEANSPTDLSPSRSGWYFQFNRRQGFFHNGFSRIPGIQWDELINENSNWTQSNDPCHILLGDNWRIPRQAELQNLLNAPISQGGLNKGDRDEAYHSQSKMAAFGRLYFSDGGLDRRGDSGYFWSSSQAGRERGTRMFINDIGSGIDDGSFKSAALSIRCIKD